VIAKVAVSSTGQELSSQVEPRFGRSPYFILIDPNTKEFETIENPNVNAMGGAGIQTAQLVANNGIEVVLTGSCGPNAYQTLQAAGVKVITGVSGTVNEALERYKSGHYKPTSGPNVAAHSGMGSGFPSGDPGLSRGGRMGGGRRVGMGRGMGRGMGSGFGTVLPPASPPVVSHYTPEQELQILSEQVEYLEQQLAAVNDRIRELKGEKKPK
jgi:predicted Fe-Mo cluster-binding NifX family protein